MIHAQAFPDPILPPQPPNPPSPPMPDADVPAPDIQLPPLQEPVPAV